jgi:hypothetical protein
MTVLGPRCQAHLIFQIGYAKGLQRAAKSIVGRYAFALYSVPMEPIKPPCNPDSDDVVSRRSFGGKLLYVPPTVLAVIKATERPALAQSGGLPQ